jgi:hypothetical protein
MYWANPSSSAPDFDVNGPREQASGSRDRHQARLRVPVPHTILA